MTQATTKQVSYIKSLTNRLKKSVKPESPTYPHIIWGIENCECMTTREASDWIDHLRQLVRTANEVTARYALDGKGKQI